VDREALRAFAGRDRAAVDASKRAYHARRHREGDGSAGFLAGQALWQHARRLRPEWPDSRERDKDLAHHVELKRQLDRAAHALARR
jgi:hypothetical protein